MRIYYICTVNIKLEWARCWLPIQALMIQEWGFPCRLTIFLLIIPFHCAPCLIVWRFYQQLTDFTLYTDISSGDLSLSWVNLPSMIHSNNISVFFFKKQKWTGKCTEEMSSHSHGEMSERYCSMEQLVYAFARWNLILSCIEQPSKLQPHLNPPCYPVLHKVIMCSLIKSLLPPLSLLCANLQPCASCCDLV